jgi:signal transduction histidine kinase
MFSYVRYFAIASLLLILAGVGIVTYYFIQIKTENLVAAHTAYAEATLGSYSNTVWQRHGQEVRTSAQPSTNYQSETGAFFQRQPFIKVTLFSPDVKQLYYSSTNAYAANKDASRITLIDLPQVQSGRTASRILHEAYFKEGEAPNQPRVMVQLILPIAKTVGATPEALAELYMDVTDEWQNLHMLQNLVIGAMAATFTLMLGMLFYMAARAETIISKQHEVNLELTAAASQAEAQSQDKSQFLASVSHELRTPLNAIIGFSEILRNEVKPTLDKIYQEHIDDIYASGKHLLSLINDILDFSKAEAGKLQMEWAETDATKIIRNSLRMVLPRAETAQVTLIESIPSHHLVLVTDPKKLKQVLLNLLSNAVKFTPAGGEVRCQAWVDVTSNDLVIVVSDTGIGIAPKDISKVMTPFGQVESALSRRYEGTGLGLPLSKKFVESMGGEFAIKSELNVGTTITLTFPNAPPTWRGDDHSHANEDTHVQGASEQLKQRA